MLDLRHAEKFEVNEIRETLKMLPHVFYVCTPWVNENLKLKGN